MKKNLEKGPSKRLRLKSWVKELLEFIEVLWNCTIRLSIIVLVITITLNCFSISKAEMTSSVSKSDTTIDIVQPPSFEASVSKPIE